jgi:DNA-binding NarL/FixJ family response regulator
MGQLSLQPVGRAIADAPRTLIVVADDLYGVGLTRVLRDGGIDVVARVATAAAAREALGELEVDVVLIELRGPRVGPIAIARLRELDRRLRVLALSATPAESEAVEVLSAGASGYLPMDADGPTLAAAVRAAFAGDVMMTRHVAAGVLGPLRAAARVHAEELEGEPLTPRELEVVARIAEGLANEEIARELVVSTSTVKNHVARIVVKLGARNRTHAAALAVARRYV